MKMKNRLFAMLLALTMFGAAGCSGDEVDEVKETETKDEAPVDETVETESTEETEEKTPVVDPEIAALIENGMIDVVSNDGNFDLRYASYTVQSDDTWVYLLSLNDRYTVYVTYEEDGELDKNVTLHILDREKAEFTYVIPLDTQYHPHMIYSTDSGWILYNNDYDEGDEFYKSAYSVEITDDWCEVDEVELPVGLRNERYIYSPDGKYAAYLILTDYNWNGGINLVNPDGTTEQIFTNEVIDLFSTEDNFRYRPMCFLDNTHLLLRVGHGDGYPPLAYYIYDVTTGETTECPMGKYHPKAYGDGMVYLSDHMAFNDAWAYDNIWMTEAKNLLDGVTDNELTLIASRDENTDVFCIKELGYSDMTGGFWYSYSTSEVTEGPDRGKLYDRYIISTPDFSETAADIIYNDRLLYFEPYNDSVVFVEKKVADSIESPAPLEILSNDGGLSIRSVEIPLPSADARYTNFDYDDRYAICVTYEQERGADGKWAGDKNVSIYVVDTKEHKQVYSDTLDTTAHPTRITYSSNSCVLYSTEYDDAAGEDKLTYAFELELTDDGFSGREVEIPLYPISEMHHTSSDGQYTAYFVDDSLGGHGGVEVKSFSGESARVFSNTAVGDPIDGGTAGYLDVRGYTLEGFADDRHLLYTVWGWEQIAESGVYDVVTGETTLSFDGRYHIQGTANGAVYLKFSERGADTVGGMYDSIWKATPDGELTMLASAFGDENVTQLSPETYLEFEGSLWCNYTNTEPGTMIGEFTDTVTVTLYSPDLDETLAEIEYPTGSYMGIYADSVTVVMPVYID